MKQVHGVVFYVVFFAFPKFSIFFNIKKVQHGNSRGIARTPTNIEDAELLTIFNGFVNYCCKALHLKCLWGPGYTSGNSVT